MLSSYRGKVVLLNFWATWCEPCLTEMPTFVEWQKQYGSGNFQVIGISMDDAAPEVIATVSRLKLNYPVLMGDEYLGEAYGGVLGLPVTFLIDRDGKIRARYEGASLTRINSDIQKLLQSHLNNFTQLAEPPQDSPPPHAEPADNWPAPRMPPRPSVPRRR